MKPVLLIRNCICFAFLLSPVGIAEAAMCEDAANAIEVTVKDVRNDKGVITIDLFDDNPENFLKGKRKVLRVRHPAAVGDLQICVLAPMPGTYAIGLYHDENFNKKLDQNFIGLPVEPYGVSNNPGMRLGPPLHKDAAFKVDMQGVAMSIKLRH